MSVQQGALLGSFFQPLATSDKGDVSYLIEFLLFLENLIGEVLLAASFIKVRAMVAFLMIIVAGSGMVADTCAGPHVVHGPYDGFSR